MNEQQRILATKFIKIVNPLYILGILIFYLLGAGIHRYLGVAVDWLRFITGLGCIVLLHCSAMFLNAYFDGQPDKPLLKSANKSEWKAFNLFVHKALLSAGLTTLTAGSVMAYLLIMLNAMSPACFIVLGFVFIAVFIYAVPPFKLTDQGMGEVILTVLMSNLYPAFAFLIQNGEMHRLVALVTFPLTSLLLSVFICMGLQQYLQDMLAQKKTLLQRIQWKFGMKFHNILVFLTFLLAGLAIYFGLSWSIAWPYLFALPLSGISVLEIIRIQKGEKPRWNVLLLGSFGSLGCTLYLITFALWTG